MKLNQVVAIEKGAKSRIYEEITKIYQKHQKSDLLNGLSRSYTPAQEDGDTLPPESKRVQVRVTEDLKTIADLQAQLLDLTATRDFTNASDKARADVKVDGKTIVANAPIPYLLWLEKQLTDMRTIVSKLPTLDPAETWNWSDAENCYATPPTETVRTKKVPRNHVKAEATEKHPAQVELYYEDVKAGTWRQVKYSGAVPAKRVADILERVDTLLAAVKIAREDANAAEATEMKIGKEVFAYLFG